MKKTLMLLGLAAAIACGSSAGDMMNEAFDDMTDVPDAGAQSEAQVLLLPCDLTRVANSSNVLEYATVPVSSVPGAFTAFLCDWVDKNANPTSVYGGGTGCEGRNDCPLPDEWECVKMDAPNTFLAEGSYWFYCGNAASDNPRPTTVRVVH